MHLISDTVGISSIHGGEDVKCTFRLCASEASAYPVAEFPAASPQGKLDAWAVFDRAGIYVIKLPVFSGCKDNINVVEAMQRKDMPKAFRANRKYSRPDSTQITVILWLVLQWPVTALAIESSEFHLFGAAPSGVLFDITPYGADIVAAGDPNSEGGIVGQFFNWQPFGMDDAKSEVIGTCRVRNVATSYTFSCEQGQGRLAGTLYVGEEFDARAPKRNIDTRQLLKVWDKKMDHGAPDVFYRCKEGCTNDVPKSLLFIWYGD